MITIYLGTKEGYKKYMVVETAEKAHELMNKIATIYKFFIKATGKGFGVTFITGHNFWNGHPIDLMIPTDTEDNNITPIEKLHQQLFNLEMCNHWTDKDFDLYRKIQKEIEKLEQ